VAGRGREGPVHEISVMTDVVATVLREAKARGASRVLKVNLQVGELTFLGEEQMHFAFDVLKMEADHVMDDAEVAIETVRARGSCAACGYTGETAVHEEPEFHFRLPTIDCPKCGQRLELTDGRDLYIRDIVLEVPDDEGGACMDGGGTGGDGDA